MAKENSFMDMIDKGVKDTKKEGIMTAEQYKLGGDLNYVIEMMKNETDPDKLEELKSIIREMLGTSPYMSIRQDPVRKAADGGFMEKIKNLLDKFKTNNDEPRFFAGQPLNEAAENDPRYQAEIKKKVYRDLGYTDEEIDEIVKKGAGDFLGLGEVLNQIEPSNKAEGGIMELAPGGSTEFDRVMELEKQYEKILSDYPELKETRKLGTFSTGGSFENFLEKLGFTKKENGKIRGSRSAAAAAIGVKPADFMNENRFASMAKLYNLAKEKGLRPKDYYIPKELAGYGLIQPTEELATGMKYGQGSAKTKQEFNEFIAATKKKASDQYGANPSGEDRAKKNIFIEKEIKAKFPNLKKGVGLATLTKLIASKALGAPLDILMPSEIASGELLTEDELAEMRIREKFK